MISSAQMIFAYLACAIGVLALLAVNMRNPVHSVLMVLVMFFHMAGLYLTLNAEFLAAVQVIVYAGAVLVLYLFVIFLVNLKAEIRIERFISSHKLGISLAAALWLLLLAAQHSFRLGIPGKWTVAAIREATHTKALGTELLTDFALPFEITGIILLVAVVGGIFLAKSEKTR